MATIRYHRLDASKEQQRSIANDNEEGLDVTKISWTRHYMLGGISFALCVAIAVMSFLAGIQVGERSSDSNIERRCWDMHTTYCKRSSPVSAEIDIQHHDVLFNGTLDFPSPYRGKPSKKLDAAWEELEDFQMMRITEDELEASPYHLDSARLPSEAGGGYMGSIEVIHKLHCLNFIRKSAAWKYDYYKTRSPEFSDSTATLHTHYDHCVEMLRQDLMCNADVGLITYRWTKGRHSPHPNFNNWHSCKNFGDIMTWARGRQIPPLKNPVTPQKDDTIWDAPP